MIMVALTFVLKKFFKKVSTKKIWQINSLIVVLLVLLIIDKKFSNINKEMNFINEKLSTNMMASNYVIEKEKVYSIDILKENFPNAKIYEKPINEAIDIVSFKTSNPNAVAFIGIIDLNHPNVNVKVTPEKKHKYLTSEFAKENNCIIAINGEAGESMAMDCKLGEWTGNWISDGNVILMEDTDKRPFIGFSKNSNLANYSVEKEIDTVLNDQKHNAIWGRFDILVENEILLHEVDVPYARTIMGSSADGSILYLMVVDGKRPDYSEGLTYYNCAKILQSLGASNAMACDQGGSSCMYVSSMGGIINRPADSDGIERSIYSHFGISMP